MSGFSFFASSIFQYFSNFPNNNLEDCSFGQGNKSSSVNFFSILCKKTLQANNKLPVISSCLCNRMNLDGYSFSLQLTSESYYLKRLKDMTSLILTNVNLTCMLRFV